MKKFRKLAGGDYDGKKRWEATLGSCCLKCMCARPLLQRRTKCTVGRRSALCAAYICQREKPGAGLPSNAAQEVRPLLLHLLLSSSLPRPAAAAAVAARASLSSRRHQRRRQPRSSKGVFNIYLSMIPHINENQKWMRHLTKIESPEY